MAQNAKPTGLEVMQAMHGQNILDKVVAYVNPRAAVARMGARGQLALSGGYSGARIDKAQLSRYNPLPNSAVADTVADLPRLRARSRDQMRNAPVALGALSSTVGHVVGTGLSYSPAIDAKFLGLTDAQKEDWQNDVKRRFKAWAESTDCDIARQCDFYGLQELAFRSFLESGDVFALTPRIARGGNSARLVIQLIEADRVCNPDNKPNSDTLIDGVEIAPATGEAIAYHIAANHPGGLYLHPTSNHWTRVAARGDKTGRRNVLHIFKPLRPGWVRGVPWIAPIIEPLKQLDRWSEAELNAAVISGLHATFVTMDPEAFQSLYDEDVQDDIVQNASKWSGGLESGKVINLMPGESIASTAPGRPNPAFDPFWTAMVRQIGMALDMPFEVLVMHFQSSYSAARGALLMAWRAFRTKRDLLAKQFCQPVADLWLADEIANGRISAPGYFSDPIVRAAWSAAIWTGDGPGSIDPEKEVRAARDRIDLGISTKQAESILHDGVDWEQKHTQRVKEIDAEKRDGIYTPPAGSPAQPPQGAAAADAGAPAPDATATALGRMADRIDAMANKAPQAITIHTPPVEVRAGDIHVAPAAVTVEGHDISVSLPEGCIQLEATVAAPVVQVDVPAPQVIVQQGPKQPTRQTFKHDADGNIVESLTEPMPATRAVH